MKDMIIPRVLGEKILSLAELFPIISITGPRQSGKTTIARALFPEYAYVNLESLDDRLAAEEDPLRFLRPHSNAGRRPNTFFWRNSTGHEIDLIIDAGAQLWAVEIKSGETLNEDFFKGLKYFKRLSSVPESHFYLLYGGKRDISRKHGQVLGLKSISNLPRI